MIIIVNEYEIEHKLPPEVIDYAAVVLVVGASGDLHLHKHIDAPYSMTNSIVDKDTLGHNVMDLFRSTTLKIEVRK